MENENKEENKEKTLIQKVKDKIKENKSYTVAVVVTPIVLLPLAIGSIYLYKRFKKK